MGAAEAKAAILANKTALGIEFGQLFDQHFKWHGLCHSGPKS